MFKNIYNDLIAKNEQVLVYVASQDCCHYLKDILTNNGIPKQEVRWISASGESDDNREKAIKDFKGNKYRILINIKILTTGFDYPRLNNIIILRTLKSPITAIQIIGRGLRKYEGKKHLNLFDPFCNNVIRDLRNIDNHIIYKIPENIINIKSQCYCGIIHSLQSLSDKCSCGANVKWINVKDYINTNIMYRDKQVIEYYNNLTYTDINDLDNIPKLISPKPSILSTHDLVNNVYIDNNEIKLNDDILDINQVNYFNKLMEYDTYKKAIISTMLSYKQITVSDLQILSSKKAQEFKHNYICPFTGIKQFADECTYLNIKYIQKQKRINKKPIRGEICNITSSSITFNQNGTNITRLYSQDALNMLNISEFGNLYFHKLYVSDAIEQDDVITSIDKYTYTYNKKNITEYINTDYFKIENKLHKKEGAISLPAVFEFKGEQNDFYKKVITKVKDNKINISKSKTIDNKRYYEVCRTYQVVHHNIIDINNDDNNIPFAPAEVKNGDCFTGQIVDVKDGVPIFKVIKVIENKERIIKKDEIKTENIQLGKILVNLSDINTDEVNIYFKYEFGKPTYRTQYKPIDLSTFKVIDGLCYVEGKQIHIQINEGEVIQKEAKIILKYKQNPCRYEFEFDKKYDEVKTYIINDTQIEYKGLQINDELRNILYYINKIQEEITKGKSLELLNKVDNKLEIPIKYYIYNGSYSIDLWFKTAVQLELKQINENKETGGEHNARLLKEIEYQNELLANIDGYVNKNKKQVYLGVILQQSSYNLTTDKYHTDEYRIEAVVNDKTINNKILDTLFKLSPKFKQYCYKQGSIIKWMKDVKVVYNNELITMQELKSKNHNIPCYLVLNYNNSGFIRVLGLKYQELDKT